MDSQPTNTEDRKHNHGTPPEQEVRLWTLRDFLENTVFGVIAFLLTIPLYNLLVVKQEVEQISTKQSATTHILLFLGLLVLLITIREGVRYFTPTIKSKLQTRAEEQAEKDFQELSGTKDYQMHKEVAHKVTLLIRLRENLTSLSMEREIILSERYGKITTIIGGINKLFVEIDLRGGTDALEKSHNDYTMNYKKAIDLVSTISDELLLIEGYLQAHAATPIPNDEVLNEVLIILERTLSDKSQ